MVKDETFPQTQPRLNLATFVTTYMDDYGTRLMNEAVGINYIDETEYPRVAVMCGRCINMVANLWNTPEKSEWKTGAVGIGSSEACMLGGVAAWLRWRERRKAEGKPFDRPNLIMSTGYQVVWEKFCQLWQIEMRTVPITKEHPTLNIEETIRMCDENTICIVPIMGVTWTGMNDDVEALDMALEKYNKRTGHDIPIHIDAASGGFILPFLQPDKKWDFRLKWVLSISTSGHKYGLVYPGLGWVIWRDKKFLPMDIAKYCHDEIGKMPYFKNYSEELENPLFIWYMNPAYDRAAKWTLFDLQDKLMQSGWMVPAYTMPKNIEDMVVMRVVVRQGMSRDMADMLIKDIKNAVAELDKLQYPTPSRLTYEKNENQKGHVFTH